MRRESLAASAAANAGIPAPLGTVTLAFTDIQSSTSLWEHLGEMKMKELLDLHNVIMRDVIKKHQGYEVSTTY